MTGRRKVQLLSEGTPCAAWHYPGDNGGCVVMGGGSAVTKEPATDRFARRFHEAGFSVLAFDPRHLGESGGQPRQVVRMGAQLADWRAAIAFARTLPEVAPERIAAWGFSLAGGHVLRLAAEDPELAAAIAQAPLVDGQVTARNALRHTTLPAMARLTGRALADGLGRLVGRDPLLVPLVGPPGSLASLSSPDALQGPAALDPDGSYPDWQQEIAAWSALRTGFYRPGRFAARVRCPLLVVAYDDDTTVLAGPAVAAAERAPRGELVRRPGGHYEGFLTDHDETVAAELAFLRRHVLGEPAPAV